jgi:AraC-like DNA-binding protein
VPTLAAAAGLGRSAFAARFTTVIGKTPLAYLAEWRLNLAADRLRSGGETVGTIAQAIGYSSEPGFSRAFRARFGRSPSEFRRADD